MSSRRCQIVFFEGVDGGLKYEDGFILPSGSIVSSPPEEDIVFDKAQPSTIQPCGLPGINHFRKLSFDEKQEECNYHQRKSASTTRKKNKKKKDTVGGEKGVIDPVFDKAQPSTIQPCGLPGINHFRKLSFHEKQEECNYYQKKSVSTSRKKNKKKKDTMGGEKGVIDPVFDKAQPSTIQPCGLPGINHFRKLSFHEKQEEFNYHQRKSVSTTRKQNKKKKDTMGGEKGVIDPAIPAPTFIGYRLPPPELTKFVDTSLFPILALSQEMLDAWSDGPSDLE